MHIHHLALYTADLPRLTEFYKRYFGAVENSRYHNPDTGLSTCFLEFDKGGMLEVMTRPGCGARAAGGAGGYHHLAMCASAVDQVDFITKRLAADGYTVQSGPRLTGDHYYESVVLDPDGNPVEITAGRVHPACL